MKLTGRFKLIFLATLLALYFSGALTWLLEHWFQINSGFGETPRPQAAQVLHWHSVIGLWFLFIFGYFYHSHVMVSWRLGKKRRSGLILTIAIVLVMVTVPGILYFTDGNLKIATTWVHTYVGLALILPYAIHQVTKLKPN